MLKIDNLIRFTLSQIFRDRSVVLNATFVDGAHPHDEGRVRVVTEPVSDGTTVGYALERRLKSTGEFSERVHYGRSFVRIDLIGSGDMERMNGFGSVAVSMYRPGKSYEYISFKLDTKDFFISELDRGDTTAVEMLFNSRQDCSVTSVMVMTAGIPPVVGSPKKGGTIAYYERFGFGRYVVGLNISQYLASWGAFFPEPKKPGDSLSVEFIVTIETPFDFLSEMEMPGHEDDEEHNDTWAERIVARYQLEDEPSLDNDDSLEFRFSRTVILTDAMLGLK
jgi:hypothetical protein